METGRQKLKDETTFYNSLDKNNSHSSSCLVLIIIFLVLVIINVFVFIYLHQVFTKTEFSPFRLITGQKESNTTSNLVIYQSDLQSRINGPLGYPILLLDKKILIKSDGIYLKGKIPSIGIEITFITEPEIKNQKIVFNKVKLVTKSDLASSITSPLSTSIAKSLTVIIGRTTKKHITQIDLKEEQMILTTY